MPGEVSIPPHETGVTTYSFHAPGKVLFACHLPGHFAYGMKGYVIVDAATLAPRNWRQLDRVYTLVC